MSKPDHYYLKVDSLLNSLYDFEYFTKQAAQRPISRVPQNSDVSSDNLSLGGWSDDEEVTQQAKKDVVVVKKTLDKSLIALQPFKLDRLQIFPHKAVEGHFPGHVLVQKTVDYLLKISKGLEEQQKLEKH